MPAIQQQTRTSIPNHSPISGSLQPGQLAVEMADPLRLWVGVPASINAAMQKLLFDSAIAGNHVLKTGDTMTGPLTISPTGGVGPALIVGDGLAAADLVINGGDIAAGGPNKSLTFQYGGRPSFSFSAVPNTGVPAEDNSLELFYYNDAGTTKTSMISFLRNANVAFRGVTVNFNGRVINCGGTTDFSLGINSGPTMGKSIYFKNGATGFRQWAWAMDGVTDDLHLMRWDDLDQPYPGIPDPLQFNRLTGLGTVTGDPTLPLGIATKQYVDGRTGNPFIVGNGVGDAEVRLDGGIVAGAGGDRKAFNIASQGLLRFGIHSDGADNFIIFANYDATGANPYTAASFNRSNNVFQFFGNQTTIAAALTIGGPTTNATGIRIDGTDTSLRAINWSKAGLAIWALRPVPGTAGDLEFSAYDDTGQQFGLRPLYFERATGLATVRGDPTSPLGIATKKYVDAVARDAPYLPLIGGAMTPAGNEAIYFDGTTADDRRRLLWRDPGPLARWGISMTDAASGGNLEFERFDDAGARVGSAIWIERATGMTTFGATSSNTSADFLDGVRVQGGAALWGALTVGTNSMDGTVYINSKATGTRWLIFRDVTDSLNVKQQWGFSVPAGSTSLNLQSWDDAGVTITPYALSFDRLTGAMTTRNIYIQPGHVLQIAGTGANSIILDGVPLDRRSIAWRASGVGLRWAMGVRSGTGAEDWALDWYDNVGTALSAIYFERATGLGMVAGDPISPLGIATKQYVDTALATGGGAFLPLTGGSLTGELYITTNTLNSIILDGDDVNDRRRILWRDPGGLSRWGVGMTTGDFWIEGFDDAGASLGSWFEIDRLSGLTRFNGAVSADFIGNIRAYGVLTAFRTASVHQAFTTGTPTSAGGITIDGPDGSNHNLIFSNAGLRRWQLVVEGSANAGGNVGSEFSLLRFDDDGQTAVRVLQIARDTKQMTIGDTAVYFADNTSLVMGGTSKISLSGNPTAALHAVPKQYADSLVAPPLILTTTGTIDAIILQSDTDIEADRGIMWKDPGGLNRHRIYMGPSLDGQGGPLGNLMFDVIDALGVRKNVMSINGQVGTLMTSTAAGTFSAIFSRSVRCDENITAWGQVNSGGGGKVGSVYINAPAASSRLLTFRNTDLLNTGGQSTRQWALGIEGGNDDLQIMVWDDLDMPIPQPRPLRIKRATGLMEIRGDPTVPLGIATKQYVDSVAMAGGAYIDAPSDGTTYARKDATWVASVPMDGGTFIDAVDDAAAAAAGVQLKGVYLNAGAMRIRIV